MKKLITSIVPIMMPSKVKIPEEYLAEFEVDMICANIEREKLLAVILIIINLFLFFLDAAASNFWTKNIHFFAKFNYFHYILLAIAVVFLFFSSSDREIIAKNLKIYRVMHPFILSAVMGLCSVISARNAGLPPFAYIVSMFSIASLIIMDKFKFYIIYLLSYVLYAVIIINSGIDIHRLDAYLLFLVTLLILAIIFSVINVASYKKSFMDRKIIVGKNMELNSLSTLLIRSNAVLRAQLETSLDGIIVIDKNNRVLCYNQKFIDILGLTADIIKYRDGMRIFQYLITSVSDEVDFRKKMADTLLQSDKAYYEKICLKNGAILDIYTAPILYINEDYGIIIFLTR